MKEPSTQLPKEATEEAGHHLPHLTKSRRHASMEGTFWENTREGSKEDKGIKEGSRERSEKASEINDG